MSEKREMTAVEFLKEWKRMCETVHNNCGNCPLEKIDGAFCRMAVWEHPEEAIAIVQKWAEEHPQKTMLQDFLEKYPNAPMNGKGFPDRVCPKDLGYVDERCPSLTPYNESCFACWNRPLEVEE